MTGMDFVINDKGEKTGLLIDLAQLRHDGRNENDVMDFLKGLEDVLAVELSKDKSDYSKWEEAKERLRAKGIID